MASYRMDGNELKDANYHVVARIDGNDIKDANYNRIGTLDDARRAIDGAMGGVSVAALWIFFVR